MRRVSAYITVTVLAVAAALLDSCGTTHPYSQGQAIYEYKCANCHQPDGSGLIGNIPALAQADWLAENREEVLCVIRYGMQGPMEVNGLPYNGVMRGYPELTPTEAINVANYILYAWGNELKPLGGSTAPQLLEQCGDRKTIQEGNPQRLRGRAAPIQPANIK